MAVKNPKIDAYIAKSMPFAIPILEHFRDLVHKTCPDVEEKMKWSFPHFDYKGQMMCSMASFKQHAAIGFWKALLMKDANEMKQGNKEAMGHYGRITSINDLPNYKIIIAHIKEAMRLNEEGVKLSPSRKAATSKERIEPPVAFIIALNKNLIAKHNFEAFSPSHVREYLQWITEAKTEATRDKRIATAIEWLGEGKARNWKYESK